MVFQSGRPSQTHLPDGNLSDTKSESELKFLGYNFTTNGNGSRNSGILDSGSDLNILNSDASSNNRQLLVKSDTVGPSTHQFLTPKKLDRKSTGNSHQTTPSLPMLPCSTSSPSSKNSQNQHNNNNNNSNKSIRKSRDFASSLIFNKKLPATGATSDFEHFTIQEGMTEDDTSTTIHSVPYLNTGRKSQNSEKETSSSHRILPPGEEIHSLDSSTQQVEEIMEDETRFLDHQGDEDDERGGRRDEEEEQISAPSSQESQEINVEEVTDEDEIGGDRKLDFHHRKESSIASMQMETQISRNSEPALMIDESEMK